MIAHGFKRENVPLEYLKQKRSNPKSVTDILEPVDLDWAFVYTNNDLENITKTTSISNFCKTQHIKYIAPCKSKFFFHANTKDMHTIVG